MTNSDSPQYQRLKNILSVKKGVLKIALSGGIDSLTLMTVAAGVRTEPTIAVHAISAAVPQEATNRCRDLATEFNWQLEEVDAREFDNKHYMANPANRCYYCKSSLFDRILADTTSTLISPSTAATIATGTNTDDLGDYRPGLLAARERHVWQPYVEAQIDKITIRYIAKAAGLGRLSQLPAQPCLSSRIETGIAINVTDLRFVHRIEKAVTDLTEAGDIRCRITRKGVVVQLPVDNKIFLCDQTKARAKALLEQYCAREDRLFAGFERYRMGSAFLVHKENVADNV